MKEQGHRKIEGSYEVGYHTDHSITPTRLLVKVKQCEDKEHKARMRAQHLWPPGSQSFAPSFPADSMQEHFCSLWHPQLVAGAMHLLLFCDLFEVGRNHIGAIPVRMIPRCTEQCREMEKVAQSPVPLSYHDRAFVIRGPSSKGCNCLEMC